LKDKMYSRSHAVHVVVKGSVEVSSLDADMLDREATMRTDSLCTRALRHKA
jgi:hypothetical protein